MTGIIILWHIFFLVVGFLVGILVGRRIERRSTPPAPRSAPEKEPSREPDPALFRAGWVPNGKMWVELDGLPLEGKLQLSTEQQGAVSTLIKQLRPWAMPEMSPQKVQPVKPAAVKQAPAPEEKGPPPRPAMKTIIEQINDVLQARLASSSFKERGIALTEGPDGSVIVMDGQLKYEGIDAVPEADIRTLIRESVADWEKTAE